MLKIKRTIFTASILLPLSSGLVHANNYSTYPLEFSEFFIEQKMKVNFIIAGEQQHIELNALTTYDTLRIDQKDDSVLKQLKGYLQDHSLSLSAVDLIMDQLINGIDANPGCDISVTSCIPFVENNQIKYVFDFDNAKLKLFIGSSFISRTSSNVQDYYPAIGTNNGLINSSQLFVQSSDTTDLNFSLSNDTLLGLPLGYLEMNSQYRTLNDDFNIYSAIYNADFSNHRLVLGYADNRGLRFNTTDFLNTAANYSAIGLHLGTSRNLLKGGIQNVQKIQFIAPQSGQLEIYKDEQLILSKVISSGTQTIGYGELPSGAYVARIILRSGENILIDEFRSIVNNSEFSLPSGDWDYLLNVGYFDDATEDYPYLTQDNFSRIYGQMRSSLHVIDGLMLAAGGTSNGDSSYVQLGGKFYQSDYSLEYYAGYFTTEEHYQYAQILLGPFSLTSKAFNVNEKNFDYRLSTQLYGDQSFNEYSFGVSGSTILGNSYVNFSRYSTQSHYSGITTPQTSNFITLGTSTDLLGGMFNLTGSYNVNDNQSLDTWNLGVSWTYNLGSGLSGQIAVYSDRQGFNRNENALTASRHSDDWSTSGTVSGSIGRNGEHQAALSGTLMSRNEKFKADAYSYANSTGTRSFSGTLTNTQIVTKNSAMLTSHQSNAFIRVAPVMESNSDIEEINYNLYRDSMRKVSHGKVKVQQESAIPINPYEEIQFSLDTGGDNFDILDPSHKQVVYPGTVFSLESVLSPLRSQIFVLDDITGEPIQSARCIGTGCVNIESLSDDGVFRVNYRENQPFKLVSHRKLCVYEEVSQEFITSTCLPGLYDSQSQPDLWSNAQDFSYIGKFNRSNTEQILKELESSGLQVKTTGVGNIVYVHVYGLTVYTPEQINLLDSLSTYALLDTININELFTVR